MQSCQVLSLERDDDGFLVMYFDGSGNDESDRPEPVEALMPYGLLARPRAFAKDGKPGANGLVMLGDGRPWGMVFSDPRVMKALPPLNEGSAFMYGDVGDPDRAPFLWIDGDTGIVQLYAPHGTSASTFVINTADKNAVSMQLLHGKGMGISIIGTDIAANSIVIHNRSGSAAIEVGDNGIVARGKMAFVGGIVAGNVEVAEEVALGKPLVELVSKMAPVFTYAIGLAQAAGAISPGDAIDAGFAIAKYALFEGKITFSSLLKASSDLLSF